MVNQGLPNCSIKIMKVLQLQCLLVKQILMQTTVTQQQCCHIMEAHRFMNIIKSVYDHKIVMNFLCEHSKMTMNFVTGLG